MGPLEKVQAFAQATDNERAVAAQLAVQTAPDPSTQKEVAKAAIAAALSLPGAIVAGLLGAYVSRT